MKNSFEKMVDNAGELPTNILASSFKHNNMKEYIFKGTSNQFIFVKLTGSITTEVMEDFLTLSKKYRMTVEDLNMMPHVHAENFPKVSDGEYVFILNVDYELSKEEVDHWQMCFDGINGPPISADDYPMIAFTGVVKIKRIKKRLLPFR